MFSNRFFEQNYYDLNITDKEWGEALSNISENSEYLNNNLEENNTISNFCFFKEKPTNKEKEEVLSEKAENHINKYTKCNYIPTTKEISKNKISQAALSQFRNPEKNDEKVNDEELYFLNKKAKRDRNIKTKNKFENNKTDYQKEKKLSHTLNSINNNHQIECIELEEDKKVKFGRKKKEDSGKGKHDKNSKDNIINKIKINFINYFIREFLNYHSINKDIKFKKLPDYFISDLNKKHNEILYKKRISDILSENKISSKYKKFDKYENKKIIDKIFKEKKEINIIKILELTFEELFIIYRRKLNAPEDMKKLEEMKDKIKGLDLLDQKGKYKDIKNLTDDVKKKYKDELNELELNEYIKNIENLCLNYEKWFNDKVGRTSKNERNIKK